MPNAKTTEFQRLRYWQGQMLGSRDFRDQFAIEAQTRWWHNRALHNVFGVSEGLETSMLVDPKDGKRKIRICPGLAYDCFGRELILQNAREILVPEPREGENRFSLLIRYKDAARFPARNDLVEICKMSESSNILEEPELIWKLSKRIEVIDGVSLVRLSFDKGAIELDEGFILPLSRPFARPRISYGATIPGKTFWEPWTVPGTRREFLGIQVKIDTGATGFTQMPCYFAWLQGPLWDQITSDLLFSPLLHLTDSSIRGFTLRLWVPDMARISARLVTIKKTLFKNLRFSETTSPDVLVSFAQNQELFVSWLGIQPNLKN